METSKWIHWAWQVQVQVHVVSLGWRIFSLLLKLMVNDCCCCRRRRECCLPSRYVWKRVKARKAQIMVVLSATTSTATAAHKVDQFYALLCLIIWAISETTATANCCSRSLSLATCCCCRRRHRQFKANFTLTSSSSTFSIGIFYLSTCLLKLHQRSLSLSPYIYFRRLPFNVCLLRFRFILRFRFGLKQGEKRRKMKKWNNSARKWRFELSWSRARWRLKLPLLRYARMKPPSSKWDLFPLL